ncbi:MAG: single-stranded DNA-binding protein [Candidatus Peregrinibacteria bacterium]
MFSVNRISIIGYQTQALEVRKTPGGTSVADLNMVVPYSFTSPQGEQMMSKAFQVVTLWGSMAEFAGQYVHAGSQLYIGGRLQTDSWDDPTTKEKRSKTKIIAMDMILLDPKDGQLPAPENAKLTLAAVNRADLVGNVTREPELKTTTGGHHVLSIGIATNDRWKEKATGEMKERAEFHNVVIWGALAEEAGKVLHKGSRVFASGRVQTRSWETQQGQKRYTTEIVADQCALLGVKSTIADEAIDRTNERRSSGLSSAPQPQQNEPERESVGVAADTSSDIPEVQYKSEIKVEDLPF